ncbi:hypothetical protein CVT25_000712 [Psilocybe cyanescens]|uniref:Uncharacterized protein n=1 Tax=Psilocybe cyanescens TaxID=93625 RepID=A0A409XM96_PSICY|nr:hypothetical protein CVT25_000712 [Psilocybe cyanescens]
MVMRGETEEEQIIAMFDVTVERNQIFESKLRVLPVILVLISTLANARAASASVAAFTAAATSRLQGEVEEMHWLGGSVVQEDQYQGRQQEARQRDVNVGVGVGSATQDTAESGEGLARLSGQSSWLKEKEDEGREEEEREWAYAEQKNGTLVYIMNW